MKYFKFSLLLSLLCFSLISCGLLPSSERNAFFKIQAVQYLNPDIQGQAAPLVITFYQLKKSANFTQASYTDLASNPNQTLGDDLLDKQTAEILPNSIQKITLTLSQDTHFIGVVAAYRDIAHAHWQLVVNIDQAQHAHYQLDLASQGMSLRSNTSRGIFE